MAAQEAGFPEPSDVPLVVLTDVNKHFGSLHVLRDINLTIHKGEVVVVLGPSGSGKSTLCRAINRLETIGSGQISIDGVPLPEEGKALAELRADVEEKFKGNCAYGGWSAAQADSFLKWAKGAFDAPRIDLSAFRK